jgi:murein DD-endopeptidase MepM/ murein hydrolase activator NlpD
VHRNNSEPSDNPSRIKALIARLAGCAALVVAALILSPLTHDAAPPSVRTATPTAPAVAPAPVVQQAGMASIVEVVIGRNDTLDAVFRRLTLNLGDLATIRHLPGIRQSLDYLKPGDAIKVTHTAGDIQELVRKVSETQTLDIVRQDAGFEAKLINNPVETRLRTATATIDSSLFQAAEAANISDPVALKLANVFAWDIDFVLDIREGDRFTAVYEQIYQDGKYLRDGEVLAAEFVNNGKVYRAVRYLSESGSAGYYTPSGLAMRKAFLRAPLDFTRVSSAFNPHRLHPILNTIRGHMGTDYAAPTGTPVRAAGDGHVSFAGWRGGYGNALLLQHGGNISTLYGHMSRFAKNIHVGTRVQQGDVIGYVGMTGLATGPHLHYEYLMNGVHRNPQTVGLPGAEPLHADALQKFHAMAEPLLASLSPQPGGAPIAAAANAAAVQAAPAPAPAAAPATPTPGELRSNPAVY